MNAPGERDSSGPAPDQPPPHAAPGAAPLISVVTPAFCEADNLPVLYERLSGVLGQAGTDWEWLVVDDHSTDGTFAVLGQLAARDSRVRGLRLSRNHGSHTAVAVGLAHSRGAASVVLAADLQDPPELIIELLQAWRMGARVVWGARQKSAGVTALDRLAGGLFHRAMRRFGGFETMPPFGSDCFLLDRTVVDALAGFGERRVNLVALIHWMGFRQATIDYAKAPRVAGRSGWNFGRRLQLAIDSVTAFSVQPIRWMSCAGALVALAGFLWAGWVVVNALAGSPPSGWSSLMVAILGLGGLQMLMLGVLGEYLWRALEESRRRPHALIEAVTRQPESHP